MNTMLVLKWSISFYSLSILPVCKISFYSFNRQNSASHMSRVKQSKNVPHISYNRSHIQIFISLVLTSLLLGPNLISFRNMQSMPKLLQLLQLNPCTLTDICIRSMLNLPEPLYYLQLEQLKPTNIGQILCTLRKIYWLKSFQRLKILKFLNAESFSMAYIVWIGACPLCNSEWEGLTRSMSTLLHLITYKKHVMIFRSILDYSKCYTLTLHQLLSNAQLLIS